MNSGGEVVFDLGNGETVFAQVAFLPRVGDRVFVNLAPRAYTVINIIFNLIPLVPAPGPMEVSHHSSVCVQLAPVIG